MGKARIKCFLLEHTGRYTEFITNISSPVMRRVDTGEEMIWRNAPAGAMMVDFGNLYVKCPDGHTWGVDGRASNCTKPDDTEHRCWIKHGDPPNVTVDKKGKTCEAGGGSIKTPKWHGFLRNGFLEED